MLTDEFNAPESRRLLKVIDDMREILRQEKISLPHIVVVGDQSVSNRYLLFIVLRTYFVYILVKVGKSSVLEALSGIQLPRAQNICTRCPLELRMKSISPHEREYATIRCEGVNETTIHNFADIMQLVTSYTVQLAGDKSNVTSKPIYLTVYKHSIQADLTLIDLPGK